MIKLISVGISAMILISCGGKSKQNGGNSTAQSTNQQPSTNETPKPATPGTSTPSTKNDVASLIAELDTILASCQSSSTLEKLSERYYIGKEIPEKTFKNISGVFYSCGEETDEKAFRVLDQIYDKGGEEQANKVYKEKFGSLLKNVQITLGEGLSKIEGKSSEFSDIENVTFFKATGAGPVNIEWKSGSTTVSSEVVIYDYTAAQVTRGAEIYANGVAATATTTAVTACSSCHAQANGADHTANRIGRCSDIELAGAITTGTYAPDTANRNSECAGYTLSAPNHTWALSAEDTTAVTAHLRGLDLDRKVGRESN